MSGRGSLLEPQAEEQQGSLLSFLFLFSAKLWTEEDNTNWLSIPWEVGVAPNLHFPHLHQTLIYTHPTFTPDPNLHKPRFTPDPNLHKPRFTQTHFWTYISKNPNLHNPNLHKTQIYTTQIYATQIYTKPKFTQPKFTQN